MTLETQHGHNDFQGELFIWTDIDPEHENDFNRWYDTEHMEERAQIPGFRWARRYRSTHGIRPYLALYRTASLSVFNTPQYRAAFERQTEWSLANFARMRNTNRRIMAVLPILGQGTGSALALLKLHDSGVADRVESLAPTAVASVAGVLSQRILRPDPVLSTPLPSEDAARRSLHPFLVIDTTEQSAATSIMRWYIDHLGMEAEDGQVFDLLWELRSEDLDRSRGRAP